MSTDINYKLWKFYQSFDASTPVFPYGSETMKRILEHNPKSILEFGCNNGKNLLWLKQRTKDVEIMGVDFSAPAVARAQERGCNVRLGDQHALQYLGDKSYDVVFTVSVLDHIPNIDGIIKDFERIASKAVYLTETNQLCSELYFAHDYIKLGYKSVLKVQNPPNPVGNGAVYHIWEKVL